MNRIVILFAVIWIGCAGCRQDNIVTPIQPDSTTADKILEQDKTIFPMPAEWLQGGRLYLPHDFVLKTPNHGAQLWPEDNPNLVLWGSPILPGMASVELPSLPFHKFRLFLVARTRYKGQVTQPCITVRDQFDGKALTVFQPNGEFRTMQSPILFTRSKQLYFVYQQGSRDDEFTNIDIAAVGILPIAAIGNK